MQSILDGYVGIEVVGEVGNGNEALAHTGALAPDVVIMDVNMPELNGIEATWRIKKDHPQVRVIGLSVNNAEHVRLSLLQAGAEAFLNKEIAPAISHTRPSNMSWPRSNPLARPISIIRSTAGMLRTSYLPTSILLSPAGC